MMQDTRKAVPVLQHQDGGAETGPVSQTEPHLHYNSTTLPPTGQRVSDYLLPGRENAVPLKRLKELLDLDGRARCVRSMRRRAAEIVRAADAIEGAGRT